MQPTDAAAHPWPPEGKWTEFRFRRAMWAECGPMYNQKGEDWHLSDLLRVILMRGYYPFLCWNIKFKGYGIHGYMGWKPIPVANDPAFFWRELKYAQKAINNGELFVQLSVRGGIGDIG